MKIEIEGRADLRPVILAALDAGRFTVSMKTTPTPQGAHIEAETVFVDVLGVVAPVPSAVDEIRAAMSDSWEETLQSRIMIPRDEFDRLTALMEAVDAFAKATGAGDDDRIEHLGVFTEAASDGRMMIRYGKPTGPEIPRTDLRTYLESQIEDEDAQMKAYAAILSFIDETVADAISVPVQRVERAQVEQEPIPAAYTEAERAEMLKRDDEAD